MKLLTKNEIQEHKAKDKRLEIDQAVKLAKKVDTLRETLAEEEASLEKFRISTISNIKKEIDSYVDKKTLLEKEVKLLESKRIELLEPVTKELQELEEKRKQLSLVESTLNLLKESIDVETKKIELSWSEIDSIKSRIKLELSMAEQSNVKSRIKLESLSKSKELSEKEIQNQKQSLSFKEQELNNRDLSISVREKNTHIREQSLDERNVFLNARETAISDKYATLERTIKRLK